MILPDSKMRIQRQAEIRVGQSGHLSVSFGIRTFSLSPSLAQSARVSKSALKETNNLLDAHIRLNTCSCRHQLLELNK